MTAHTAEIDAALARLREEHEPKEYDFETDQTYCPAADGPTDRCDVCTVLPYVTLSGQTVEKDGGSRAANGGQLPVGTDSAPIASRCTYEDEGLAAVRVTPPGLGGDRG